MAEIDREGRERREPVTPHTADPLIESLFTGESLIDASLPREAALELADGLKMFDTLWEAADESTNLFELLTLAAGMRYTRAEIFRVQAAGYAENGDVALYHHWMRAALDEQSYLDAYATDTMVTQVSFGEEIDDDALIKNILVYLTSRSRGMADLQKATMLSDVEHRHRALFDARNNFYVADQTLVNGMGSANLEASPIDRHAQQEQHRLTDPDLAIGLAASVSFLDRRIPVYGDEDETESSLERTVILLPDFTKYGPKFSEVIEIVAA